MYETKWQPLITKLIEAENGWIVKITFTNIYEVDFLDAPKPAIFLIPEWYKETDSYWTGEKKPIKDGNTPATIKRCPPVFDAMTAGYIITSPADVYVSREKNASMYQWKDYGTIAFHPVEQASLHPSRKGMFDYPKWTNPWSIKTPKGYSILFTQPMHRESLFTIFDGIVDTDRYTGSVNFPFVLNDSSFEGLIPKGTPIAQVIPIKRESWSMQIGSKQDFNNQNNITRKLNTKFFDSYRNLYWTKKEYK